MSAQSLFALGAARVLPDASGEHEHHRFEAARRVAARRRARRKEWVTRWLVGD